MSFINHYYYNKNHFYYNKDHSYDNKDYNYDNFDNCNNYANIDDSKIDDSNIVDINIVDSNIVDSNIVDTGHNKYYNSALVLQLSLLHNSAIQWKLCS